MTAPSLRQLARDFVAGWNAFFFEPVDLRLCAAIRIAYASLLLVYFGVLGPRLIDWFAHDGLCSILLNDEFILPGTWSLLWWLPDSHGWLWAAYGVALLQAALLLVGLGSRFQAISCFIWLLSFQNRNQMILDSEDCVFRLVGALLIFLPCGRAWSLDRYLALRWTGRQWPTEGPAWALKLMQIQMCIIFFDAFYAKMQGSVWQDGTALYYVTRLEEFFPRFPVPAFLDSLWAVRLLTWGTLAVELLVPLGIWFRETRRASLLLALGFHLACDYSMNLFLFHWVMLTGWMAFLRPEDWQAFHRLLAPWGRHVTHAPTSATVTNDSIASLAAIQARR